MWCPNCQSEKTRVTATDKHHVVERYRRCDDCGYSFITVEASKFDPHWPKNAEYADEEVNRILKKRHPVNQRDMFNE